MRFEGIGNKSGEPAGSRTQFSTLAKESAGRLPPGSLDKNSQLLENKLLKETLLTHSI
jgi:hypothetical protein